MNKILYMYMYVHVTELPYSQFFSIRFIFLLQAKTKNENNINNEYYCTP